MFDERQKVTPNAPARLSMDNAAAHGLLHRVVRRMVGADRRVTIAYNVYKPSGGIMLDLVAAADRG